jgi:hypothetical protein
MGAQPGAEGIADAMWFDTWSDLGRILVVTPLAYGALVTVLRLRRAQTLSKLNPFDPVVTVAPGLDAGHRATQLGREPE